MTPMFSLNSSNNGGSSVAICLQREAGGVGVSCRWRTYGALEMEVSLITGGCSNVGITYTIWLIWREPGPYVYVHSPVYKAIWPTGVLSPVGQNVYYGGSQDPTVHVCTQSRIPGYLAK
jgi:hypothetical protein